MLSQRGLEAFHATMKTGSVSAAAELLAISQPAVSRLIRDLEAAIQLELFKRAGNRIMPTEAARALMSEVDRAFISLSAIETGIQRLKQGIYGNITISAMATLATTVIPDAIAVLHQRDPGFGIEIQSARTSNIIPMVARGDACLGMISPRKVEAEVSVIRNDSVAYRCIMNSDDPLGSCAEVTLDDLSDRDFVGFASTTMTGRTLDRLFSAMKKPPRVQLRAHLSETAGALVRRGCGLSIVDPFAAREHESKGGTSLPIRMQDRFSISVIAPKGSPLPQQAERFLEAYIDEIRRYV